MNKFSIALTASIIASCAGVNSPDSYEFKPSYHTITAYVSEVDEETWFGVCGNYERHTFYGFEIFDEINVGDHVYAVVCDNATPFIYHDDYITQVYFGY